MKKLLIITFIFIVPTLLFAQLKSQTRPANIGQSIAAPSSMGILGIFNPDRLSMSHHFSSSFTSGGGGGMLINTYANSVRYQISNPLLLRLNLGIANMPYNSYVSNNFNQTKETRFFGGAELQYRPTSNTTFSVGINIAPNFYQYGYPSRYYRPGF